MSDVEEKILEKEQAVDKNRHDQLVADLEHRQRLRTTKQWSPEFAKANRDYIDATNKRSQLHIELMTALDALYEELARI